MLRNRSTIALIVSLACLLAIVTLSTLVCARANLLRPIRFQANGDRITDWYWLRANGHTAIWTFDAGELRAARPGSVYLNFSPLVTNRLNGGSGHKVNCQVTIEGAGTRTLTIPLDNPFRPVDPESSGGIGYQSYGHSSTPIPPAILNGADRLTVIVSYPFSPNYHLAVNRDAMVIGYSR
jgi:hypothetical protein